MPSFESWQILWTDLAAEAMYIMMYKYHELQFYRLYSMANVSKFVGKFFLHHAMSSMLQLHEKHLEHNWILEGCFILLQWGLLWAIPDDFAMYRNLSSAVWLLCFLRFCSNRIDSSSLVLVLHWWGSALLILLAVRRRQHWTRSVATQPNTTPGKRKKTTATYHPTWRN